MTTLALHEKLRSTERKISHALRLVDWQCVNELNADAGYNFIVNNITAVMDAIAPEKILL